jgi:hypothetical protein
VADPFDDDPIADAGASADGRRHQRFTHGGDTLDLRRRALPQRRDGDGLPLFDLPPRWAVRARRFELERRRATARREHAGRNVVVADDDRLVEDSTHHERWPADRSDRA